MNTSGGTTISDRACAWLCSRDGIYGRIRNRTERDESPGPPARRSRAHDRQQRGDETAMSDTDQVTRLFTIDEANATLSVIRPDIEDLLGTFKEIRAEIEAAATEAGVPIDSADLPKGLEARGGALWLFVKGRSSDGRGHRRRG